MVRLLSSGILLLLLLICNGSEYYGDVQQKIENVDLMNVSEGQVIGMICNDSDPDPLNSYIWRFTRPNSTYNAPIKDLNSHGVEVNLSHVNFNHWFMKVNNISQAKDLIFVCQNNQTGRIGKFVKIQVDGTTSMKPSCKDGDSEYPVLDCDCEETRVCDWYMNVEGIDHRMSYTGSVAIVGFHLAPPSKCNNFSCRCRPFSQVSEGHTFSKSFWIDLSSHCLKVIAINEVQSSGTLKEELESSTVSSALARKSKAEEDTSLTGNGTSDLVCSKTTIAIVFGVLFALSCIVIVFLSYKHYCKRSAPRSTNPENRASGELDRLNQEQNELESGNLAQPINPE